MYDELIKSLRVCASSGLPDSCLECPRFENGCDTLREDAADAIEVLSKKEKTTRWIPVTERLPKEQETVLIWGEQGIILLNWLHDNKWCGCLGDVTHWMPLPEPPKEET